MLRVLRKLRVLTISKGKVFGYIFYAIGEVTLVVIGILIAVRVGDWNEDRKKKGDFHEIVVAIAKDLNEDIEQYENQLITHHRKDSLLQQVIRGTITEEQYRANWVELRMLITSSITFYMHGNGFNALEKSPQDIPDNFKPIAEHLTNYYLYKAEDANYALLREDRLGWKTIEDWESKYEWHALSRVDSSVHSAMLNYFLKSPEYKNKSATYLANTRNIIGICEDGKEYGLYILSQLKEFDPLLKE